MMKRCNSVLEGYEDKLHLVEKFLRIRDQVRRIHSHAEEKGLTEIAGLSGEVLEEL